MTASYAELKSALHEEDDAEVSEEVFMRRAQARQRQIFIGKSRPEYKLYSSAVPYHRRSEHMPQTPDPQARISKRAFDRELASWRRGLHVCSAQLGGSTSPAPPPKARSERPLGEGSRKWADICPTNDWSPAGTESTRAESEASSPTRSQCQTPGTLATSSANNVKLNLFEHLSPPAQQQAQQAAAMPSTNAGTPAMQQMVPAMPAASWEMYQTGMNTSSMMGMMPNAGASASGNVMQFPPMEQQCSYGMQYAWETVPAWTVSQSSSTQLAQPPMAISQQCMSPMHPDVAMPPQFSWQPEVAAPGTPRASKGNDFLPVESPSTPLNRVMRTLSSPAGASPNKACCLRTPSPESCRVMYLSSQEAQHAQVFRQDVPQQPQQQVQVASDADPWAGSTVMVVTATYYAEAEGYLSVPAGTEVRAMVENPHCGDGKCAFPTYVFCSQGSTTGWAPQHVLWRCFVDEAGRRWACDDATGAWCWVDEMDKNAVCCPPVQPVMGA